MNTPQNSNNNRYRSYRRRRRCGCRRVISTTSRLKYMNNNSNISVALLFINILIFSILLVDASPPSIRVVKQEEQQVKEGEYNDAETLVNDDNENIDSTIRENEYDDTINNDKQEVEDDILVSWGEEEEEENDDDESLLGKIESDSDILRGDDQSSTSSDIPDAEGSRKLDEINHSDIIVDKATIESEKLSSTVATTTNQQTSSTSSDIQQDVLNMKEILVKAAKKGLGGGINGAIAGIVQVLSLMWLRTIINYQQRYGTTFMQAFHVLYMDGGVGRFYNGLIFALIQAPLARFVSTASNDGVNMLLKNLPQTKHWGPARTTVVAAIVVAFARILLMPIDTCKTVLQVNSKDGFTNLMNKVKSGNILVLYQGSIATALSGLIGHYPWFFTYNTLNNFLNNNGWIQVALIKNALIGLVASIVSDTIVNSIRVVKTTKQSLTGTLKQAPAASDSAVGSATSSGSVSYGQVISMIIQSGGLKALFGRGLKTRMIANALQSILFTIIWRGLTDYFSNSSNDSDISSLSSSRNNHHISDEGHNNVDTNGSYSNNDYINQESSAGGSKRNIRVG